jgi:pimeloyl-ACP methyl ester carboxylesterase/quercetin dioxygenase-like cupin family protein
MNYSRRDLNLLLPLLAAARAAAQTKQPPVMSATKVYHDRQIPWEGNDDKKGREFFLGATHGGFAVEMHETVLGPGTTTHAPHRHPNEEIIVLAEGTLEAYFDEKTEKVEAGSVIWLASNQMHSVRNVGATPCRYFVIEFRGNAARFMRIPSAIASLPFALLATGAIAQSTPPPRGALIDLGGHRLHIHCVGAGAPAVVIENGFEEFSFDWTLVQSNVAKFARVCTYDHAGYAWSDPGPAPRTFAQINLDLRKALATLGERGPFVLVGHAFGGPIVRNFAITYPNEVAGIVFVDAVSEDQRFEMWHKAVLMRSGAQGKAVPPPHEDIRPGDKLADPMYYHPANAQTLDPPFDRLPPDLQALHLWAQSQRALAASEENERTWSPEYFNRWHDHPESATLGSIPLVVLTREHGGFRDLDISAARQEEERKTNQRRLAALSSRGEQRIIASGEDMQIEAPDAVVQAIRDVVRAATQSMTPPPGTSPTKSAAPSE